MARRGSKTSGKSLLCSRTTLARLRGLWPGRPLQVITNTRRPRTARRSSDSRAFACSLGWKSVHPPLACFHRLAPRRIAAWAVRHPLITPGLGLSHRADSTPAVQRYIALLRDCNSFFIKDVTLSKGRVVIAVTLAVSSLNKHNSAQYIAGRPAARRAPNNCSLLALARVVKKEPDPLRGSG